MRLTLGVIAAPKELAAQARQMGQDAARTISQLRDSRQTAFSVSGRRATHRLSANLAAKNGKWALHAVLTNLRSNTPVTEWSANYEPGQLRYAPVALAGVVSGALHLPALEIYASVGTGAREAYEKGLLTGLQALPTAVRDSVDNRPWLQQPLHSRLSG